MKEHVSRILLQTVEGVTSHFRVLDRLDGEGCRLETGTLVHSIRTISNDAVLDVEAFDETLAGLLHLPVELDERGTDGLWIRGQQGDQ